MTVAPAGLRSGSNQAGIELADLLEAAQSVLSGLRSGGSLGQADRLPAVSSDPKPTILVTGPRRLVFLALGGGAFAMIFVGLAIPGVPAVTFAMLSSYYLARSSSASMGAWFVPSSSGR